MARPAFGYHNAAGDRIPGSTSVLKYVSTMDSDILLNWAVKMSRQGKDWRKVRTQAGASGSLLHDLCEKRLPHELDLVADRPADVTDEAWANLRLSYDEIRKWYVTHGPEIFFAEEPLISEEWQFGGTPDGVVRFPRAIAEYGIEAGQAWLLDYKTGKFIGAKEVAQMASYRKLLTENKVADVAGALLIHAPTGQPGYMRPVVLNSDALDLGWDVFLAGLSVMRSLPKLQEVFG